MARKPPPGPSLFGDAVMAPVEKAKVEAPPPPPPAPGPMTRGLPPAAPPPAVVADAEEQGAEEAENAAIEELERAIDIEEQERPRLHVVPSLVAVPEEEVIVERQKDGRYCVSLLRHYGTTCAAVVYTRRQLEMLQRRIGGALEVG